LIYLFYIQNNKTTKCRAGTEILSFCFHAVDYKKGIETLFFKKGIFLTRFFFIFSIKQNVYEMQLI